MILSTILCFSKKWSGVSVGVDGDVDTCKHRTNEMHIVISY